MRVCLVSVFHNRAANVPRTVESVLAQDYADLEILLVDDGSSDGTLEQLRRYEGPRVRVISHANKGFTPALKAAIATTNSELIAIQGSGDVSLPTRISKQVRVLKTFPHAVAAGCGIVNVDEFDGAEWEVMPQHAYRSGPIERSFGVSHGELMLRRDAYDRVGGYRTFFRVGQVSDLLRRMTLLGGVAYVREVLYRRYLTSTGVSSDPEKIFMRNLFAALSVQALRRRPRVQIGASGPLPPDEIDRYGALAPYFLPAEADVAKISATAAAQLLVLNRRADARRLAAMSLRHKLTIRGLAAWCLAWTGPRAAPLSLLRRRPPRNREVDPLRFLSRAERDASAPREPARLR
jgi:hypothetical protein